MAEHEIVLGTISGMVRKDGQPVPDDTEVNVYIASGLQQTVLRNSIYRATTIGDLSNGKTYLPVTIKIERGDQRCPQRDIVQDIDLPRTPPLRWPYL
ncbi:MAG: hypothetical protein R2932_32440 [Caldilineaceae bacterium]